jgi:hypothetical protein
MRDALYVVGVAVAILGCLAEIVGIGANNVHIIVAGILAVMFGFMLGWWFA